MKLLTGSPGDELNQDWSNDEVDVKLILEYIEFKRHGGGTDYGPPDSAWMNGTKAHENLAAWKLLDGKLPGRMTESDAMEIIKRYNPYHILHGEHGGEFTKAPGGGGGGKFVKTPKGKAEKTQPLGRYWNPPDVPEEIDDELKPRLKATLDKLASRYRVPIKDLGTKKMSSNTMAMTFPSGEIFLSTAWRLADWVEEKISDAHETRVRSDVYDQNNRLVPMRGPFLLQATPEETLIHEYAHVLTAQFSRKKLLKMYSDILSMGGRESNPDAVSVVTDFEKFSRFVEQNGFYSATDPMEAIAEGFVAYERGEQTPLAQLAESLFRQYRRKTK